MKTVFKIALCLTILTGISFRSPAQEIPGIGSVTGLVKRVIKAIDLKVQRLQNNTIALQNAQKALENTMSRLHLSEIASWAQQQKAQYEQYYRELWQVKTFITGYHRIREISKKQTALVRAYKQAWNFLHHDSHFSPEEFRYMARVYSGILERTLEDADGLLSIVSAFTTQMDDAARMKMVDDISKKVEENYSNLQRFNSENAVLSIQRDGDAKDAAMIGWMYGL